MIGLLAAFTHPLIGASVLAAAALFCLAEPNKQVAGPKRRFLNRSNALELIMGSIAVMSLGVHIFAILGHQGLHVMIEQLKFQAARKLHRSHALPAIKSLIFATVTFFCVNVSVTDRGSYNRQPVGALDLIRGWSRLLVDRWQTFVVAGYCSILFLAALWGEESWYYAYISLAISFVFLVSYPKFFGSRDRRLNLSLFGKIWAILLLVLLGKFVMNSVQPFGEMSVLNGTHLPERELVEERLLANIPNGSTVLTDSYSMRMMRYENGVHHRSVVFVTSSPVTPYLGPFQYKLLIRTKLGGSYLPEDRLNVFSRGSRAVAVSKIGVVEGDLFQVTGH
jgi:hypothetical protein